jgi:hypothetical protein
LNFAEGMASPLDRIHFDSPPERPTLSFLPFGRAGLTVEEHCKLSSGFKLSAKQDGGQVVGMTLASAHHNT